MFAESVSGNLVGRLEKSCHLWEGNRNIVQIHVQCHVQCSSDISEPKYTRNTRQPNTRIRVYIYANARMHIRVYVYTVYARMLH